MAVGLQGSLDVLPVAHLLRLPVSGRLRIVGDRGGAEAWLDDGFVVAAHAEGLPVDADLEDAVFELLRFAEGWFGFDAGLTTIHGGGRRVDDILPIAQRRMVEWRSIEAVVPSTTSPVHLVPELAEPDVVVDGEQWRTIVAAASAATVGTVVGRLHVGEVDGARAIKGLVDVGLAVVDASSPVRPPEGGRSVEARRPPARPHDEFVALGAMAEPPWQFSSPPTIPETLGLSQARIDLSVEPPADEGPEWAAEERLERVFADWIPGPAADAGERDLLVLDELDGRRGRPPTEDRGLLGKLLASLRS